MTKEEIKVPIPEEYSTVEEWAKSLMEQRRAVRVQRNVVSEDEMPYGNQPQLEYDDPTDYPENCFTLEEYFGALDEMK